MDTQSKNSIPKDERIQLLDGSIIKGYKLAPNVNCLQKASNVTSDKTRRTNVKKANEEDIFLQNAFYLLAHAKEIKSDSRMFLSNVPVQSGLAYVGGFPIPTLGVYIEWWLNNPQALMKIGGSKYLVWLLSGSPFTGMNRCGVVNEQGDYHTESLFNFGQLCASFRDILSYYNRIKGKFQAYTLEETIYELRQNDKKQSNVDSGFQVNYYFLLSKYSGSKERVKLLKQNYPQLRKEYCWLQDKLTEAFIKPNKDVLLKVYRDYHEKDEEAVQKRDLLKKQLTVLQDELTSDQISYITYKRRAKSINDQIGLIGYGYKLAFNDFIKSMNFKIDLCELDSCFPQKYKDK